MSALLTFRETIPLSLYIHLPWCVRKCPYCDFNSHESGTVSAREMAYVDALVRDLDSSLPLIWGRRIHSIFIGGGTPSLFSPAALEKLLQACQARLNPYPDIEITLEANPGTAEAEKFREYRALGINRLSIGVQSFSDTCLQTIGRIHDAREARNAIEMAHAAEFAEINLDLMYGLPGQSVEAALDDLQAAIGFQPQHLSWYQLTLEPNTVFAARPPTLPAEDLVSTMQEKGDVLLQEHGYQHYEISAYAQPDRKCTHNLNYWQFGDYLGIGAGSHSKLTDVAQGTVSRITRHRIPERYIELAGKPGVISEDRKLSRADLQLEFMMNALRLTAGVHPSLFMQRTGLPISSVQKPLKSAVDRNLLEWDINTLRPTTDGQRYLNDLLQFFM